MKDIVAEKQRRSREYYLAHQEEIKARVAKYRLDNPKKVSECKRKCYEARRTEYIEKQSRYVREHREQHNERGRKWREANPEKNAARCRRWKASNHDKVLESWRKRRATQLSVEGDHFTDAQFTELCESTGNKCLCCGRTDVKLTADHVIPLALCVPRSDEISNIQPLCRSCNSRKSSKQIDYRFLQT